MVRRATAPALRGGGQRPARVAASEGVPRSARVLLEAAEVEVVGRDPQHVSGRSGLDAGVVAEHFAQLGDLPVHLRDGADGWRARVEIVGELLDRDDTVRAQEKDGERRPLLRSSEGHRLA